ncbi:MAG: Lysozyme [candidate division TM6 bacterium GW2011_GWF2_43_17]|nr:MAG: Lysozyme [candidate division TM6 bacterium GW2011_GWF2_43_17]HAU30423.1 glycoside hydrolase [Candidatus Dependentiae bacterium]
MKKIFLVGVACVLCALRCLGANFDECLEARRDARVRAFLDVIAHAEGTYLYGVLGYSARYPMRWFNGFGQHPGYVSVKKRSGQVARYSASGRYMFLVKTWDYLEKKLGLSDFGPLSQDVGAIALLAQKGALKALRADNFERAVLLANKTWATFPGSPYGQTTTTMPELKRLFSDRLVYYRGGGVL